MKVALVVCISPAVFLLHPASLADHPVKLNKVKASRELSFLNDEYQKFNKADDFLMFK